MTAWLPKFAIAQRLVDEGEEIGPIDSDFFISDTGASPEAIRLLKQAFPSIPDDYVRFLEHTDGAEIAQCTLFGSEDSEFTSFTEASLCELYESTYPRSTWFVFGHDAGGNPLLLSTTGSVSIGDAHLSRAARNVAQSFSEFLSNVLFGGDYPKLYDSDPDPDDPWWAFLKSEGWVSPR